MDYSKKMKVVIFSCDSYSWIVPTFLHFYKKNWPDNPYETVVVTETEASGFGAGDPYAIDYGVFYAGKIPWSDRAAKYLNSIDDETFLLFLEEYILNERVNTDEIKRADNLCVDDIGCVRLHAYNSWSSFLFDSKIKGYKEYPIEQRYSVSHQSSIWQRRLFLDILKRGESNWQMETEGSKRFHKFGKRIIWKDTPIINYHPCGYMRRRKVVKSEEQWVRENW